MIAKRHLRLDEYNHMVACGAFDRLDRRVQLIRGEILESTRSSPMHDDLVAYLTNWSFAVTSRSQVRPRCIRPRCKCAVALAELDSCPEPDVFWIKSRRYLEAHPTGADTLLAIEVADSSLHFDRTTKADLYAAAGIEEYWVVDVQGKCIYLMREIAADNRYGWQRTVKVGETLNPLAQPSAILDVADLFGVNSAG